METRQGGFSLIELLVVVSVVAILASIAIPNMRNATFRARAVSVAADLDVLSLSTVQYNADQNAWPGDAATGVVPPELVSFLPDGFSFQGNAYELDYENIALPFGLPGDPSVTQLIGANVTATDDRLSNAIQELLGGTIVFSVGNMHTVVIDAS